MIKKINFGKVDGYGIGRRTCDVELEFGFREYRGQEPYFTVCGNLWDHLHTDILQGGQCVDSLWEQYDVLRSNELYCRIKDLWEMYHLKKKSEIPEEALEAICEILDEIDSPIVKN